MNKFNNKEINFNTNQISQQIQFLIRREITEYENVKLA